MTSRTEWTCLLFSILLVLLFLKQRAINLLDRVVRRFPKYKNHIIIAGCVLFALPFMVVFLFHHWFDIVEEGGWIVICVLALWIIIVQSASAIARRFPKYENHIIIAGFGLAGLACLGTFLIWAVWG